MSTNYESCTNITNVTNKIRSIRGNIRNSYTESVARGFTLIELLVSISIFALITTAVVANFRAGERADELRLAAEQFASALRELETAAQTGSAPEGGYGVHIDTTAAFKMQFFVDELGSGGIGNKLYNVGEELAQPAATLLPPSVQVTGVLPNAATLDVLFEPPTPTIWINGGQDESEARIILRHDKTGQERVVVIKRLSGRIEVE